MFSGGLTEHYWSKMRSLIVFLSLFLVAENAMAKGLYEKLEMQLKEGQYPLELDVYKEKYADYDCVLLEVNNREYLSGVMAKKYNNIDYYKRYLILNPANENLGVLPFRELPTGIIVSVLNPDGQIIRLSDADVKLSKNPQRNPIISRLFGEKTAKAMQNLVYFSQDILHGSRDEGNYMLILPDIQIGSIVEFHYVHKEGFATLELRKNSHITYYRRTSTRKRRARFKWPCELYNFEFGVAANSTIVPHRTNLPAKYELRKRKKFWVYSRTAENIAPIHEESYSPDANYSGDFFHLGFRNVTDGPICDFCEFWDEVLKEDYERVVSGMRFEPDDRVKKEINALCEDAETDLEHYRRITNWVQNYYTEGKEYLDPQESTGFLVAVCRYMDLDVHYLCVTDQDRFNWDPNWVSDGVISERVAILNLDGRQWIGSAYRQDLVIGAVPDFLAGKIAINVSSRNQVLIIEPENPSMARNHISYELNLDTEGGCKVDEKHSFNGSVAWYLRTMLKESSEKEIAEIAREMINYDSGEVFPLETSLTNLDDPESELIFNINYLLKDKLTIFPEEVILNTGGLFSPGSGARHWIDSDTRLNPIQINTNEFTENYFYTLPKKLAS
jgi:hypothetical protein